MDPGHHSVHSATGHRGTEGGMEGGGGTGVQADSRPTTGRRQLQGQAGPKLKAQGPGSDLQLVTQQLTTWPRPLKILLLPSTWQKWGDDPQSSWSTRLSPQCPNLVTFHVTPARIFCCNRSLMLYKKEELPKLFCFSLILFHTFRPDKHLLDTEKQTNKQTSKQANKLCITYFSNFLDQLDHTPCSTAEFTHTGWRILLHPRQSAQKNRLS